MDGVSRADLLAAGWSPDEIRRSCRRGDLRRLGRGVYLRGGKSDDGPVDRYERRRAEHAARVEAVLRRFGPDTVASHVSAAVLWGLPSWELPLDRVQLTRDRLSGARRTAETHVHAAPLPDDDVTTPPCRSFPVTGPARTVVDIARTYGFEQAVAVADAALKRPSRTTPPLVTPDELAGAVARAAGRPGAAAARRVVAFADGRSGSVGESRSRVAIAAAGLPAPELQWEIRGPSGLFVGTVDFAWPERRAVGEFDGREKYGRLRRPGESTADAVIREKLREDAIRGEDWSVARWHWAELRPFFAVRARLERLLY